MISSIKRRGVLLVLAILPNGSRSLIPAAWTDWREADASPRDDDIDHTSSLGKLSDLLALRKVIDALLSRTPESAPHVESSHAAEPGVSRPCATAIGPSTDEPAARRWWSSELEVPLDAFNKTFIKPDGTGHRKNHLSQGVCMVAKRKSADAFHATTAWIAFLQERLGQ